MAEKDFQMNQNTDREKDKKIDEDWKSHHTTQDRYPEEAKGIGETDIKNAHASGDGSFGRNDSSVPDSESDEKSSGNSY